MQRILPVAVSRVELEIPPAVQPPIPKSMSSESVRGEKEMRNPERNVQSENLW